MKTLIGIISLLIVLSMNMAFANDRVTGTEVDGVVREYTLSQKSIFGTDPDGQGCEIIIQTESRNNIPYGTSFKIKGTGYVEPYTAGLLIYDDIIEANRTEGNFNFTFLRARVGHSATEFSIQKYRSETQKGYIYSIRSKDGTWYSCFQQLRS